VHIIYLIWAAIIIIAIAIALRISNNRRARKVKEQLKVQWGKPKTSAFDFDGVKKYADIMVEDKFHQLTEQTVEDIDFYKLFSFVDRTTSRVGQQSLYKRIIQPTNQVHNPLHHLIGEFDSSKNLREEIQFELLKLSSPDAYYIPTLFGGELLVKPKWFWLLYVNMLLLLTLAILSFTYPIYIIFMLAPITINMFVHYWNKGNTFQFVRSFPQLNTLIGVCNSILKRKGIFSNSEVDEAITDLKSFQRKSILLSLKSSTGLEAELALIGLYFIELFKIFFLIEVFTLFRVIRELRSKQQSIITLFNYVGDIDSAISILSLRASDLKTCLPSITPSKKELVTKAIYHPLIDNCVKNNLVIKDKSILITGSNMSGKSSFLRTLAINSILAQTIYTCFADEFISPSLKQFSSIRIDDNLFQGKSYYLQEVSIMGSLIAESDKASQNLFVLDEVFKGTNTVERIASAKAILSYLNRKDNIVIIATHDIELAEMLKSEYDLYHFTETIASDQLYFDHQLKAGSLKTRNAIKLLELADYPADVIREAKELSARLGK
jgi:MutS domain V